MARSKEHELSQDLPKKKRVRDKVKSLGLFDHVKHIREIRDPNYFLNLSEQERRSFNHFTILKALSMNPDLLETISTLYQYFDIIPSAQFYTLLISIIPQDSTYYPWIKPKNRYKEGLIDLISKRFEVSSQQSEEYVKLLSLTDEGINSLVHICQGFGKTDNEIEQLLSKDNDDE